MLKALIGQSGFVGGNLARQTSFDRLYNSSNIKEIEGQQFDLLVVAGVRAVKWWANQNPEADRASIDALLEPLRRVRSRETIVISTIDVYPHPSAVDEGTPLEGLSNHPYGAHRFLFEQEIRRMFPLVRVVRLPGLFGAGLKKNVIFDLVHHNGLEKINPDSVFQYYDLSRLAADLEIVRTHHLDLVNFATEPLPTRDILTRYFPEAVVGQNALPTATYDMRTRHAAAFNGQGHYLESTTHVLHRLGLFLETFRP